MEVAFANPAGFWGLLGIPAVILIHFLQRQSKERPISTLFLLQQAQRESAGGAHIERFRTSIPFWLQILAVLLLTWLLTNPRWQNEASLTRIAVVIDSSASMSAFQADLAEKLPAELKNLSGPTGRSEFFLLDSHLSGQTIYHGADPTEMMTALKDAELVRAAHDPSGALRVARGLVGKDGVIILATDHHIENPAFGAHVYAIGNPIPNVGFSGLKIDDSNETQTWRAMVRNYSETEQTRTWNFRVGAQLSEARSITIPPGKTLALEGAFPNDPNARVTIELSNDAFTIDDTLPIRVPDPKTLYIHVQASEAHQKPFTELAQSLRHSKRFVPISDPAFAANPDLLFTDYNPLSPILPKGNAVITITQKLREKTVLDGTIVATNHPLVDGLNWQSLICRNAISIPRTEADEVLLWQGERPLVMLREQDDTQQLLLNFELDASNALRLAAPVVMIHRFAESIRSQKIAPETRNLEANQHFTFAWDQSDNADPVSLTEAHPDGAKTTNLSPLDIAHFTTPKTPGFFELKQGDTAITRAATHFADTREADFTNADSHNELNNLEASLVTQRTKSDPLWRLWILLLIGILLFSWFFIFKDQTGEQTT